MHRCLTGAVGDVEFESCGDELGTDRNQRVLPPTHSSRCKRKALTVPPVQQTEIGETRSKRSGWVTYFAVGDSSECFSFVRDWVEKKVRAHLMRARERAGLGWKRWSRQWLYEELGLYNDYRLRRPWSQIGRAHV